MSGPNESSYFGEYPKDFFDLIIIDECHRGGANDESNWRDILDYFSSAVQIGLTATPKRNNNVDTYSYFGNPVYTYSLKDGIEDEYLTPFRVDRIQTTIDDYRFIGDDKIIKGENYLNPIIEIIADDALDNNVKIDLEIFLKKWLADHISDVLGDLINLTQVKLSNQYLRALSFQLYENNGIIKRKNIDHIIKLINKDERKKLWGMGIKLGRYHVYLPKMLKPKAVALRTTLWKLYNNVSPKLIIPKSGLNFFVNENFDDKFLLICGFEKFNNFFVRVDILEKLFINILDNTADKKFKINSDMMNLLGCTKDNFFQLIQMMNYKKTKEKDTYYFAGESKKNNKTFNKKVVKSNPFSRLLSLNIK